jgi:hypothetical protein
MTKTSIDAREVARHYSTLPRTVARPAEVTIDGQTYPSAIVEQERDTPRGSRAYLEGERTYVHSAIVCVGRLPETYASRDVRAYQRADGSRWYVAGYWQGAPGSEYSHLYPFGRMFQLMRDDVGVTLSNQYGRPYSAQRLARVTRPVEIRELAEVTT